MILKTGLDALHEIFLPKLCAVCTRTGCRSGLCQLCGKVVALALTRPQQVPYLEGKLQVFAAGKYDAVLARTILAFKSQMRTDLLPFLSAGLQRALQPFLRGEETIYLVPVPSSLASLGRRGFAPAELLARSLTKAMGSTSRGKIWGSKVLYARVLKRPLHLARKSKSQKGSSESARRRQVAGSMVISPSVNVQGLSCVLIDDVVTSGATLLEAQKILEDAGAKVLGAATVAWVPRKTNKK